MSCKLKTSGQRGINLSLKMVLGCKIHDEIQYISNDSVQNFNEYINFWLNLIFC